MQTVAASRAIERAFVNYLHRVASGHLDGINFPIFFESQRQPSTAPFTRTWFGVIRPRRRSRQVDEIAIHDNSSGAHQSRALTAVRATFEP
jgi:hypothetical protein